MLLTKSDFIRKLRAVLNSHITMEHPVVAELFHSGKNEKLLKMLTLQGYQLTKHFLKYIDDLYYHCPSPKYRRKLLFNLWEEQTGKLSGTKNHVLLMQDFIRAIGITDEERDAAVALSATQELIDYRMNAVENRVTYHIGAAAVMIASEGQNLETKAGEARHSLLGDFYGLEEKDLLFFSVHQAEDVGHVNEGLSLVAEICITEKMQKEAIDAVDHTCRLFWNMYEAVYQEYTMTNSIAV